MATGRSLLVQHLHLGPTGKVRTFNETSLPLGGQLGQVFEEAGKFWRLVQFEADPTADVNAIDGGLVYYKDRSAYLVSPDYTDSEGGANFLAGGTHQAIDVSTITADPYIFIQVGGEQLAVVVAASAVAGDHGTGGSDNELVRTAEDTAPVNIVACTVMSTRGTTTSDEGASVSNSSTVFWHFGLMI